MNRTWRVVLLVFVLLVAFRLALPYIVTRYIDSAFERAQGYEVKYKGLDLDLYRATYEIDSIVVKRDSDPERSFLVIPHTEVAIEWESVFRGALVNVVRMEGAQINFVVKAVNDTTLHGTHAQWIDLLRSIAPFDVNRIKVIDGIVNIFDMQSSPEIHIPFHSIQLDALNLCNVSRSDEPLPSRVYLQGFSPGNGQINIAARMYAGKNIPDLDMDIRFENVDLKAFNQVFQAYAHAGISNGTANLYSEITVSNGQITGYVKPLFAEFSANTIDDAQGGTRPVWRSMISQLDRAFANGRRTRYETTIPIEGTIADDSRESVLPSIWAAFAKGFQQTYKTLPAKTYSTASSKMLALQEQSDSTAVEARAKTKKELRKEKRKEKRQERRRARKEKKGRSGEETTEAEAADGDPLPH